MTLIQTLTYPLVRGGFWEVIVIFFNHQIIHIRSSPQKENIRGYEKEMQKSAVVYMRLHQIYNRKNNTAENPKNTKILGTKNCLTITQPNQKHGTITKTITPNTPLKKSLWWLILVELDCIEVEVIDSWLQLKSVSSLDKIDDTKKSNQIKLKITWSFLVRFKNRTESKKVEFDWLGFLFSILKSNCTEETKLTKLTFSLGPYPTLAPKQQTTSVQIYQDWVYITWKYAYFKLFIVLFDLSI